MAHFAKIESNLVTQVIVINNDVMLNENNEEQEELGIAYIHNLYNEFPKVKFYDYTKIYKRALKFVNGEYPKNYHLTYSLNEDNKAQAKYILKRGGNISAVFRDKKLPKRFLNYKVFNGDKSDLRFNDPKNVIVGLYAKGRALKDNTGFVQDV